eukprot:m51a1_g9431 putative dopamine beta hydroxylase (388) ;mRNA; r:406560-407845
MRCLCVAAALLALAVCGAVGAKGGPRPHQHYRSCRALQTAGQGDQLLLMWTADGTGTVDVRVESSATGFVAVGFTGPKPLWVGVSGLGLYCAGDNPASAGIDGTGRCATRKAGGVTVIAGSAGIKFKLSKSAGTGAETVEWSVRPPAHSKGYEASPATGTTVVDWSASEWDADECGPLEPLEREERDEQVGSECFNGGSYTSPNKIVTFHWEVTSDNTAIDFVMYGRTQGWISIGFAERFSMTDSDKITGWVDDNTGAVHLYDTWCVGDVIPKPDADWGGTDNLQNVSGYQNATHTVIKFRRLLNTGDTKADLEIGGSKIWLLWGFFDSDGTNSRSYGCHDLVNDVGYGGQKLSFAPCLAGYDSGDATHAVVSTAVASMVGLLATVY